MYTLRRALALGAVLALLATGCGDDDDTDAATSGDPSESETTEADDEGEEEEDAPTELTVTLADGALELSSDSVAGGAIDLVFENESETFTEVDLTHVEDGTSPEAFTEGFAPVLTGGPFPDFAIDNAGVGAEGGESGETTISLEPGEYIVWTVPEEGPPEGEGDEGAGEAPPPEAFVTATLTVLDTESGNDFPETTGTITARDYEFEVDVSGAGTYTFVNEGPVQFHHAIVVDFGTNDPEAVETALPELLASEDGAPPESLDAEQIDFEFGGAGVFGPDGKGTFEADFTEGDTYAVVCFIQDRTGGPPHAIANDMWEVFQAG